MKEKVFVSWSGGKDSYLSLLKAQENDLNIQALLNFLGEEGRSKSHGVKLDVLKKQAEALGFPLETEIVSWKKYEEGFIQATQRLKAKGITGGVFGDINLPEHRQWVENMCQRINFSSYLPLWNLEEDEIIFELLRRRCRLLIVALKKNLLSTEWLGKDLDMEFYKTCKHAGITPCGERGEFHTLVIDGPLFKAPLQVQTSGIHQEGEHAFLNVTSCVIGNEQLRD